MLLNLLFSIYRKPIKCEWCIKTINIDLVGFMLQNEKKIEHFNKQVEINY